MEPSVSVLVPFKNPGPQLALCIDSVLQSTFEDFELLLIDDFSTDNSRDTAVDYSRGDSRISISNPSAPGLVPALNKGLEMARGRYIARMDSDDICHATRLAVQFRELEKNPGITLTSCLVNCLCNEKLTPGFTRYIEWVNSCLTHSQISQGLFIESPLPHPTVMFKRESVTGVGGYRDYQGPEDYDLWIRLAQQGCLFSKLPETLLDWRIYSHSLSRTDSRYLPRAFEARKFEYLLWTLDNNPRQHESIFIMGAGKMGGRLGRRLLENNLPLAGFIDIDPLKQAGLRHGLPVMSPEDFFNRSHPGFIIAYVTAWGARKIVLDQLTTSRRIRGRDFIIL